MEASIEKYNQLRSSSSEFVNEKLLKFVIDKYNRELVISSAKKLNMLQGKKDIVLDNEDDTRFVFDFALFEEKVNGKTAIQLYKEEIGLKNETEEKMMEALEKSYTSLFKVINTSPSKGLVFLKDMLNRVKNTRLTDLNLSKTGNEDILIFARIVPFEDMNITSGMACGFTGEVENILMREYEQYRKVNFDKVEFVDRFLFFHNAFRHIGIDMRMEKV